MGRRGGVGVSKKERQRRKQRDKRRVREGVGGGKVRGKPERGEKETETETKGGRQWRRTNERDLTAVGEKDLSSRLTLPREVSYNYPFRRN